MIKVSKAITLFLITTSFPTFIVSCDKKEVKKIENLTPAIAYAKVSKTKANVGDKITYELNTERDPKVTLVVPKLEKYFKDFDISKNSKEKSQMIDNRVVDKYIIEFQSFNTGSYILEPIEIKYIVPNELKNKFGKDGKVKTSKIFLDIENISDPNSTKENQDIDDIKPLEKIPVITAKVIAVFLLLIGIFSFAIFYLIKILRKPEKILLPHEKALLSLSKIDNTNDKTFYFTISEVIRTYLFERFDIPAVEKTTQEIDLYINNNENLNTEQKKFLQEFLDKTDFYKFTDYKPENSYSQKLLEQSSSFINETKEVLEAKNVK